MANAGHLASWRLSDLAWSPNCGLEKRHRCRDGIGMWESERDRWLPKTYKGPCPQLNTPLTLTLLVSIQTKLILPLYSLATGSMDLTRLARSAWSAGTKM